MDRTAFLLAILAAPDDAAVRLIFADWLEENGHEWERLGSAANLRKPGRWQVSSNPHTGRVDIRWLCTDGGNWTTHGFEAVVKCDHHRCFQFPWLHLERLPGQWRCQHHYTGAMKRRLRQLDLELTR